MRYLITLLPLLFCAACSSSPDRDRDRDNGRWDRGSRDSDLEGPRWVLVEMNQSRVNSDIDLQFESDGSFHGTAGDERYDGTWRARRDQELSLSSIDVSHRRDRDDPTKQERRYLDKLERIERYTLSRDRLELYPNDRDNSLVFERRGRVSYRDRRE